ncbi:MAG: O-antigen ligase family protein [Bacteroidetes bacterium]|nr:O-antigen ligase family protein [Bacteroidota bacterium]
MISTSSNSEISVFQKSILILLVFAGTFLFGYFLANGGVAAEAAIVILPFALAYIVWVFYNPKVGFISVLIYAFFMPTIGKHIPGLQVGLLVDGLMVLSWLGIFFYRTHKFRFRHLNNNLVWLAVFWMGLTVLQIANPSRPSIQGWFQEMRSAALYWFLMTPLTILVMKKKSDITLFLDIIIIISLLGALYGMKQLYIGVDAAENRWLEAGARKTHILFGKLRVFSFYNEAAQFGASQAHIAVISGVLATGPFSFRRKFFYWVATAFIFYGMLISGTRGAMGALLGGGLLFLILIRQTKLLVMGLLVGVGFFGMLKFTYIGQGNDQIRRMRTSLDPNDASLQVRLINQRILKDMLASKPFGTGVGTIGQWGTTYNKHIPTAKIPPDSLYVKIWVMYGIIGFILWFGIMMFIIAKGSGIAWCTRDPILRNQLIALCAGSFGSLFASYGNEVMNALPSSVIVFISWTLVFISRKWDTPEIKSIQS